MCASLDNYLRVSGLFATPFESTGNYSLAEKGLLTLSYRSHDIVVKGDNFTHVSIGKDCRNIKLSLGLNSSVTINQHCTDIFIEIVGKTAEQILRSSNLNLEKNCTNVILNGIKIV